MQPGPESYILLEGDGMASVCVARLLTDAGIRCVLQANPRPKLAAILLGEQTQHLLRELFPANEQHPTDLFAGFASVARRIVLWSDAPEPLDLPHRGVVAPEAELLRRLWERVPKLAAYDSTTHSAWNWRVQTSRATITADLERAIGNREARFATVELHATASLEACWVESVASGWLFLLTLGDGTATLIAVGGTAESLLAGSRLVARHVVRILKHGPPIPSYPRLTNTLVSDNTIACGSAAMSFDPLCGEGAGNAVREAFLAAAVIRASLAGASRDALAHHYTDRLTHGFLRHLQICRQFYTTGGTSSFWAREAESLLRGIDELQQSLAPQMAPRFRLVDRDLLSL